VNLDSVLRVEYIVLVYSSVTLQSSLCILRLPNKVKVNLSLRIFGLQFVAGIISTIVMVIPNSNYFGRRVYHLLVI